MTGNSSNVHANHKHFIHSSVDGSLGWLQWLSDWEGAGRSVHVQVSLRCVALASSGWAAVILPAPMVDLFSITDFHAGLTSLHTHHWCTKIPFCLHTHQHLLPFVFLMAAFLTGVRWNHNIVLICISDGKCGWTFVFPVYRPFVFCIWKTLCNYTVHLLTGKSDGLLLRILKFFDYSRCESFVRWEASKDIFLHSVGWPFTCLFPLLCGSFSCHEIPFISCRHHFLRNRVLFRESPHLHRFLEEFSLWHFQISRS